MQIDGLLTLLTGDNLRGLCMIVPKHRIRALHNFDWNKHWIQIQKVDGLAVYSAQDVEVVTLEDRAVLDVGHWT